MSGDGNGLSDPFMNVHLYGNDRQTSVIDNTVNPVDKILICILKD